MGLNPILFFMLNRLLLHFIQMHDTHRQELRSFSHRRHE